MSTSVNKVILIGRLGKDPETRYTAAGEAVTNFSLATDKNWKDKTTNELKGATEWHKCTAFDKTGTAIQEYCTKGSQIYLEGELTTKKWTDKNKVERYTTSINVHVVRFLSKTGTKATTPKPAIANQSFDNTSSKPTAPANIKSGVVVNDDFDDDIPF